MSDIEQAPYTLPGDGTRAVLLVVNTHRETARDVAKPFADIFLRGIAG